MKKGIRNWLISASVCGGLFILLVVLLLTVDVGYAVPHAPVGLSTLNGFVLEAIGENPEWETTSGLLFIAAIGCVIATCIMSGFKRFGGGFGFHRRSFRNLIRILNDFDMIFDAWGLTLISFVIFEVLVVNYRPIVEYGGEIEASFPSTHTLISVVLFGVMAVWLAYLLPRSVKKYVIIVLLCAAALVSALARLMMGVHWLTDVLGGMLLGGAIVSLCGAGFSWLRSRDEASASRS